MDENNAPNTSASKPDDKSSSDPAEHQPNLEIQNFDPDDSSDATAEAALQKIDRRAPEDIPLAEELGIENLINPIFGGRGRLFSAAGPKSPVVEFTSEFVIMHPPQKPFSESRATEDIVIRMDRRGVLVDELGKPKGIAGAKYKGAALWYSGEQKRGTLKHYAVWFDDNGGVHKLHVNGEALTTEIIYRLRNKTHDGELAIFPDIVSD